MSDVRLSNLPWRAGTKTEHGTYHPATVFDANGDAVLHFYDIPLHTQLEDIDRKRYGKTLDTIAATLTAVNTHARLIEALEAIAGLVSSASASDDHTRLHAALNKLDEARDLARSALTQVREGGE